MATANRCSTRRSVIKLSPWDVVCDMLWGSCLWREDYFMLDSLWQQLSCSSCGQLVYVIVNVLFCGLPNLLWALFMRCRRQGQRERLRLRLVLENSDASEPRSTFTFPSTMAADVRRSKKAKSVSIDATSPSEDAELVHKLATSEDDVGTVLLDAIHNDDLGAIRRLVKKYSFSNADIVKICTSDVKHAQLKTTACPLVEASRLQDAAIVSYFLFAGADANHLHEKALKGGHVTTVTPLHAAVDAASHAVADALLQAGANANVSDHRGETPLLAATRLADQNMVKLLLSKGANPAIADRQNVAPLHIGTLYGHTEIVRSLVNADADVWQRGQGGITPPQIAAREGHTHLAELFCRRGRRDINEVIPGFAPEGRSVALLHITAQYARYETTSMLIREFRADVNVRDSMGNTPLHCLSAYESSHSTIDSETVAKTAELLITKGADVTATNDVGDTPLHVAAQQHPEQGLLQTLVAAGADPHSPNANHMTPFDLLPKSDPSIKSFLQPVQDDRQMIQDVDTTSVPMDDIPATGSLKRSGSKKKKKPKDDDLTSPKGILKLT